MADITATPLINAAVADAKSLPDFVGKLQALDPSAAQQITGKALVASKSPWGTLAVAAVAWLSAQYGLGWSDIYPVAGGPSLTTIIGGGGVLAGAFLMRYFTSHPISGLLIRSKVAPPAA
jgi:hypothetical protein